MAPPRRILIVRPSALGDVCRTVPVLVSLRRAFPDARIDWVVQSEYAAAVAAHPDLDEPLLFPRRRFARGWRSPAVAAESLRWLLSLRQRSYDLVLDCQGLGRSGLITWATRARRRVGPASARELGWLGYTVRHRIPPAAHAVKRMTALIAAEGIEPVYDMRLYVPDPDASWWAERRSAADLADAPYAVLAPTSRWLSKRWPLSRWSALLEPLRQRGFAAAVLLGAPGEAGQATGLRAGRRHVVDLVGRTGVGQTMAVISGASLVIANDSAPLHMAVGLGRPAVGLYGPTDPAIVGPWGDRAEVVRAPAPGRVSYRDRGLDDFWMRSIQVEDVLARVDRLPVPGSDGRAGDDAAGAEPVAQRAAS